LAIIAGIVFKQSAGPIGSPRVKLLVPLVKLVASAPESGLPLVRSRIAKRIESRSELAD